METQRKFKLLFFLATVLVVLVSCKKETGKRTMPRMAPPYMYRDKQPMGTNIAYQLLPYQFSENIVLVSKSIGQFSYVSGTAYISIGKNVDPGEDELKQLLEYVKNGNELFVSSTNINTHLLDTLNVISNYQPIDNEFGFTRKEYTALQMADSALYGKQQYGFFYYPFRKIFTAFDKNTSTVLGVNDKKMPNYLVVKYGLGKFYFHLAPSAFSNYFLLTKTNTDYYAQVFSYLNKDARVIYWADKDGFGKSSNEFSALAIFWANPPLTYALLISCGLLLLYIAFGSKRKRRLVPPAVPNTNDSITFVQTIRNLYLQKKDNRNIAIKMMTHFLEHVRSNYHIGTNHLNAEFVQQLAGKSGVTVEKVETLVEWAAHINTADALTDQELFTINNLIYEFYKR